MCSRGLGVYIDNSDTLTIICESDAKILEPEQNFVQTRGIFYFHQNNFLGIEFRHVTQYQLWILTFYCQLAASDKDNPSDVLWLYFYTIATCTIISLVVVGWFSRFFIGVIKLDSLLTFNGVTNLRCGILKLTSLITFIMHSEGSVSFRTNDFLVQIHKYLSKR